MASKKSVSSVMTKGVLTIDENRSVKEAAQVLADMGMGSLVVAHEGTPVGIITEKDIVKEIVANGKDPITTPVRELMKGPVITISIFAPIKEAKSIMKKRQIRHLVVVDEDKVIGMISPRNLLETY